MDGEKPTDNIELQAAPHQEADAAANRALAAITDLIIATLKEVDVNKFDEAGRLCEVAKSLTKARARRAADFAPPGGGGGDRNVYGQINVNPAGIYANTTANLIAPVTFTTGTAYATSTALTTPPMPRPAARILFDEEGRLLDEQGLVWTGTLDTNALMRHMLMAFGPSAQTGAEANRARVAAEEAVELKALVAILSESTEPERTVLEHRIQTLMTHMRKRTHAPQQPEEVSLVPPDDQRGHQVGEVGAEADEATGVRSHGVGDAGHGQPPRACVVQSVGAVAVV